ncbi:TPA: cytochrome b/b6 domain-containing protein [Enterobacter kobei]|nr:cytochrome b/b6 domain-containing protein [Enterobacter kobei]
MRKKYSKQQIFLHWLSAAIIIWATASGFYVALFQPQAAVKEWITFFNVSITTMFIPFFIWRVVCAMTLKKPVETELSVRQSIMAHWGHKVLYANISVVMITGVMMMDRDINFFHLFTLPQPLDHLELIAFFKSIHIFSCVTLALLVTGHILAVMKHSLSGKKILKRMLP